MPLEQVRGGSAGDAAGGAGRRRAPCRWPSCLRLDDAAFRKRFAGTPVKRTGRDRVVRNALIAAGNSGDQGLIPLVEALLDDGSPLVRAMAVWALQQLASTEVWSEARARHSGREPDSAVQSEWAAEAR